MFIVPTYLTIFPCFRIERRKNGNIACQLSRTNYTTETIILN